MTSSPIDRLRFYDGRTAPIDQERLINFEIKSVIERYYHNRTMDAATVIDDIGPFHVDYTNIQHWSREIPDIDKRSARLFVLWAEDEKTKEVVLILRGTYILVPFKYGKEALREYYFHSKETPCYPMAVISSLRTIYADVLLLCDLLDRIKFEIGENWKNLRKNLIETLDKTELWERYVLSLDKIIYFSFLCPSIDRELIEALKRKSYRTTGVMQLLASPTPSYDEIVIQSHLEEAKRIIKKYKSRDLTSELLRFRNKELSADNNHK